MFNKDTFRLIKNTFKRFLTILLMVLIGVAFMVGLMASPHTLKYSVDEYFDKNNAMDLQLYSSYGFCDEDVESLKNDSTISNVFASKFYDTLVTGGNEKEYVARFTEIDREVNQISLLEGRMPKNNHEALVLSGGTIGDTFKIGDKIQINDQNSDEHLKVDHYEIVGYAISPEYMSNTHETSNYNNLDLSTVIYVDNDNFIKDYYTSLYLKFNNTKDKTAFSEDYFKVVEDNILGLEYIVDTQEDYLKNELIIKAKEDIAKGEKELALKEKEGLKELDEAKIQLEEAKIQVIVAESSLNAKKTELELTKKELDTQSKVLLEGSKQVETAITQVEKESGLSFDETFELVSGLYDSYQLVLNQKDSIDQNNEKINQKIDNNLKKIEELNALLENCSEEEQIKIRSEIASIELANEGLSALKENNKVEYYDEILQKMDQQFQGGIIYTYTNLNTLKESIKNIEDGKLKLEEAKLTLEKGEQAVLKAQEEIKTGKAMYENGNQTLLKNQVLFKEEIAKARASIDKAYQELDELPEAGWIILDHEKQYSNYMFENTIAQMTSIANVFPLLFFLVAALVCMTTMTRLVDEQRSQIGVFAALGFSKEQIIGKYVLYALIASLIGSLIGILIGPSIFARVIYNAWKLMYVLPSMHITVLWWVALLGLVSFTGIMILVTYLVVKRSLKEVPASLLRPKAPKNAKKVFLEYLPIWKYLPFESKITARNIIRYKGRFLMTVIGVMGCTGLLVLGFGIKDAISEVIDIQYQEIFDYNYTINLENEYDTNNLKEILLSDAKNEQVVEYTDYSSKVYLDDEEKTITVEVFDERQIDRVINLRDCENKETLMLKDGVIISEKFARNNHINKGDIIEFDSKDGVKAKVRVDDVAEMYFNHYLFIGSNTYNRIFNTDISNDKLAVLTSDTNFLINYEDCQGVNSVVDFSSMISRFQTMLEALDLIIVVIILAAGSLSFVVLFNLSEVNISERLREIATLKVLGFRPKEVNNYIFKEIFLLTFIGALLGLPLGKIEETYVMTVIDMEMVMFGKDIKFISYALSFMITMIFAFIVMLVMRKNLAKIEMVESLKSVE